MKELSACIEDYLETIYLLHLQGKVITLTELAQLRNVSIPTVRVGIARLKYAGLVHHERYSKLQITEAGITKAQSIYQAHSVLKQFLESVLGLPSELAEVDACKMEHGLHKVTIEKLVAFTAAHQGK